MDKKENKELLEKIKYGVALAYRRLIEKKKQEDGELIYSVNGKIVRVKAKDV